MYYYKFLITFTIVTWLLQVDKIIRRLISIIRTYPYRPNYRRGNYKIEN